MMNIDTGKLKKSFLKAFFIIAYAGIIGVYGVLGANALQAIFPGISFLLLMVAAALILMKFDYMFAGPASGLEKKFTKHFLKMPEAKTEKVETPETPTTKE